MAATTKGVMVGILLALAALGASPAQAGTARITSHLVTEDGYTFEAITVHYDAGPGETNDVTVSTSGETLTITDAAGVTAGDGCMPQPGPQPAAVCRSSQANGETRENLLEVALGDGDDRFAFGEREYSYGMRIDGGPGNDSLIGSPFAEQLIGGEGDDTLDSGPGLNPNNHDVLTGGAGSDTFRVDGPAEISYADHAQPVTVDMRDPLHAGSAGENDRIDGKPYSIVGSPAGDTLIGTDAPDGFTGGAGDDRVDGGGGDDELDGGPGADRIRGGSGDDLIEAGGGADDVDGGDGPDSIFALEADAREGATLRGGSGDDRIEAGPGPDVIDGGTGRDDLYGGPGGNDRFIARDGVPDIVTCSLWSNRPRGTAIVDDLDMTGACAHVSRPHAAKPLVTSKAVTRLRSATRRISLRIGCPSDFRPAHCRGLLVARHGKAILAKGRFDLAAGIDWYAGAITRSAILQRAGRFTVHYTVRTFDARGRAVTIEFDRMFTRAR